MKRKPTHDWWPRTPEPKSQDKGPKVGPTVSDRMKIAKAQSIGRVQAPHSTWDGWSDKGRKQLLDRAEKELCKERNTLAREIATRNWGDSAFYNYDELPVTTVMDMEHQATREMEDRFLERETAVQAAADAMSNDTINMPGGVQFWKPKKGQRIKFIEPDPRLSAPMHYELFPKKKPVAQRVDPYCKCGHLRSEHRKHASARKTGCKERHCGCPSFQLHNT